MYAYITSHKFYGKSVYFVPKLTTLGSHDFNDVTNDIVCA